MLCDRLLTRLVRYTTERKPFLLWELLRQWVGTGGILGWTSSWTCHRRPTGKGWSHPTGRHRRCHRRRHRPHACQQRWTWWSTAMGVRPFRPPIAQMRCLWSLWDARAASCMWCCRMRKNPSALNAKAAFSLIFRAITIPPPPPPPPTRRRKGKTKLW